jgi:translation elongation factor EF-1alpha
VYLLTVSEGLELVKIGDVSHYYTNISVAVIDLTGALRVEDEVVVKGATTGFTQVVESMQIEGEDVEETEPGDVIGLKVKNRVREGDEVFKATS